MNRHLTINRSTLVTIAMLIITVGVGTFLRFYQIEKLSFWLDEAYTFAISKGNLINLVAATKQDPNMSIYNILAFLWIRIVPDKSEGTLRALSAIFSVASIPVVFLLGRTMTRDRKKATAIGLIASFLIAINAFNIEYAQEFRGYSLTFFLATLSTLFLINAIEETESKHHWFVWYSLITVAAVYSHFYVAFMIAAQAVTLPILLLDKSKHYFKAKQILYSGIGMACLILPVAVLTYLRGGGGISWIPRPTLGAVRYFFKLITGNQGPQLFALYLLFGCIGLFFGEGFRFKRDIITIWKYTLLAGCLFLPVITALAISLFVVPIFMARYLLYVMPYLAVLTATGIVTPASFGWNRQKYRLFFASIGPAVLILFTLFSSMAIQTYYKTNQKTDWRKAAQVLTTQCSESLRLYYAPFVDIAAMYYNPALNSQKAEWWNSTLKNNPDSEELVASLPNEYSQVCLVLSHVGNQQNTIQAAIQKRFPNVSTVNYYEVEIEIYKR